MKTAEFAALLREKLGKDKVLEVHESETLDGFVFVSTDAWVEAATFLRDDPRTQFEVLHSLTAVDWMEEMEVVIHLYSMELKHQLTLKTLLADRDEPKCPSVVGVWLAADWHERETYDMYGVVFEGHPNLRRILLPQDWQGFPLRKDEGNPLEYHGIPGIAAIRGTEERLRKEQTADQEAKRAAVGESGGGA